MPSNDRRCHQLKRILRICQYCSAQKWGATLEDLILVLELDCSERTLRRDLQALEDVGYLQRKKNHAGQAMWVWSQVHKPIRGSYATDQNITGDQGGAGSPWQKAA